ncbi:MAG: outer membrane lipoprotein carrier protein LolA [Gemmatimonadota bacterium]
MNRILPILAFVALLACGRTDPDASAAAEDVRGATAATPDPDSVQAPADPAAVGEGETPGGSIPAAEADSAAPATTPQDTSRTEVQPDPQPATGQAGDPHVVLDRASEAYEALTAVRADFRQEARNPILGRIIRSRGTIYQRQPDLFLMRFDDPAGDVIVSDGAHLWVFYPSVDSLQVLRLPSAGGAGATDLRSQFIGDPAERFDATLEGSEVVAGREADILRLEPHAGAATYRSLRAWIDREDGLARRFEITETNGLKRHFELSDLRVNPSLPDSLFRFTPPEGVRIVDRG